MSRNNRRLLADGVARVVVYAMALLALVPLSLVLLYTVANGLPALTHVDFYIHVERPVGIPGAGVAHAMVSCSNRGTGACSGRQIAPPIVHRCTRSLWKPQSENRLLAVLADAPSLTLLLPG